MNSIRHFSEAAKGGTGGDQRYDRAEAARVATRRATGRMDLQIALTCVKLVATDTGTAAPEAIVHP